MGQRRKPVSNNVIDEAQIRLFEETAARYQEKARLATDPDDRAGFAMVARKYLFYIIDEISGLNSKK